MTSDDRLLKPRAGETLFVQHGQYVSCVAEAARQAGAAGLIDQAARQRLLVEAAALLRC